MKRLYAPWRHGYVTKKDHKEIAGPLKNDCIFCTQFAQNADAEHLILRRFAHSVVIMNYYPYNSGHIMVMPFEHKPTLNELSKEIRSEMIEVVASSEVALYAALKCEGMNIGINEGKAGGGGIPKHLHIHLLPRWTGDTNFLATLDETTLICSDFHQLYHELKPHFDAISLN